MKILIADDDGVSRRLLERTLHKLGHDVIAVPDGQAALDVLLSTDGPRMAIIDWMMPGLDGLQVCATVRQRPAPYVYIILLTSRGGREDMVAGLGAQADDFLTKPFDSSELQARLQSGARVIDLQSSLLAAQEALQHQATHDRLTGLWNRGMMLDHVTREFARAQRSDQQVTVALADIDHFKSINDAFGHEAGDKVLRLVAGRMQAALRKTDAIGRYGGEEFLLLVAAEGPRAVGAVLDRVRIAASVPMSDTGLVAEVTVSIGAATSATADETPTGLIARADEALYRAKAAGRNCIRSDESARAGEVQSLITPRLSA